MGKTFQYTDLTGGIHLNLPDELKDPTPPKMILTDCKNVYYDTQYGLITMAGNTQIVSSSYAITGLHKYSVSGETYIFYTDANGTLVKFDFSNTSTTIGTYFNSNRTQSATVNDALVIACLDKTPIQYANDTATSLTEAPKGGIIAEYRNRCFIALGSTLYYSKLGVNTNWTQDLDDENSGGFIENFYSSAPITALYDIGDYLLIHKEDGVYILNGTKTDDFDIVKFSYKGSLSPYGAVSAYKKHWFFNDGINTLVSKGEFGQLDVNSKEGQKIQPEFKNLDNSKLNEIIAIDYQDLNMVWFKLPYPDESETTWWIYNYITQHWFKRVQPQIVTCALAYDDKIILTGTQDGKILRENFGDNFNGTALESEVWFADLFFGDISAQKDIDRMDIHFERQFMSKCQRILRYDGDNNSANDDVENIEEEDRDMEIYDSTETIDTWDNSVGVWAYKKFFQYQEMLSNYFTSMQLGLRASSDNGEFIAVRAIKFYNVNYEEI